MFPKIRKTKLDLKLVGEQLDARKSELVARAGSKSPGGSSGKLSGSRRGSKARKEPESESFMSAVARGIGLGS